MTVSEDRPRHHVVIVGGGFAGLTLAQHLDDRTYAISLVDARNFHLFQPLLYQVATGALAASDIATPLRMILRRREVRVYQNEAADVDLQARELILSQEGQRLRYDTLVVATGVSHDYFGHDAWAELAPGLKTLEDAFEIRARFFAALERAERCSDPALRDRLLRFVVIGGGPTGVELAGALGELTGRKLAKDFRNFDVRNAEVYLVEGSDRILPGFPEPLSRAAAASLRRLGVTVLERAMVSDITAHGVVVREADSVRELLTDNRIWAAGVQPGGFGRVLAQRTGATTGGGGRIQVDERFRIPGHDDIYVIGDLALFHHEAKPLPGVAPAAVQAGRYVARLLNGERVRRFHYRDLGQLAVIGRHAAVGMIAGRRLTGIVAWWAWLVIHLRGLIGFDAKLKVMVSWAWKYLFDKYGARLITRVPDDRR